LKGAKLSSTYGDGKKYSAEKAIDGNPKTFAHSKKAKKG